MRKPIYIFPPEVTLEQAETILGNYNSVSIANKPEIEVFAGICEILYRNGFRAFLDGMHRRETGCHFNWETLAKYKTVVDFQLEWPYS